MSTFVLEAATQLGGTDLAATGTTGPAVRAARRGTPARQARPLRLVPTVDATGPTARTAARAVAVPAPAAPLRLTRRGRAVVRLVLVLLGVVVTAVVVPGVGRVAKADPGVQRVDVAYHVVQPGETLWSIAGQVAPGADRRDTVARIAELNALDTASVEAGRRIAVPVNG